MADDDATLQLIYEEVLDQWRGSYRTYSSMRERLGQIIAFIGIILNLELLGIVQIFTNKISISYVEILVLSTFFIILSLLTSAYAYRSVFFQSLRSTICLDEPYVNKPKNELIKEITKYRIKSIHNNKKILHQRATWTHISLNNLVVGILLIAVFIILNLSHSSYFIIGGLIIAILVTGLFYLIEKKNFTKNLGLKK